VVVVIAVATVVAGVRGIGVSVGIADVGIAVIIMYIVFAAI